MKKKLKRAHHLTQQCLDLLYQNQMKGRESMCSNYLTIHNKMRQSNTFGLKLICKSVRNASWPLNWLVRSTGWRLEHIGIDNKLKYIIVYGTRKDAATTGHVTNWSALTTDNHNNRKIQLKSKNPYLRNVLIDFRSQCFDVAGAVVHW